ncbi:restriction endonuclease subunit R [Halobacteriales archaeon SW_12_67_38]|nr:MAG: restriction endonuclease subunit R [Halobacteriales archaeon SW_12_67_38]
MEEGDVKTYVKQSKSLIESSPQMNEQNTKAKLVRPLIELLGWDVYSAEVELEYSMQIGRGNTRADYALVLEGAPVVFIEVKGCDTTVTDSDRSQLTSYMRQTGVDWGLLTNGVKFEILKRRMVDGRPDEVSLGIFSLEELPQNQELLELLSKDLVESGEADRVAERMEAVRKAVEKLGEDKERIADRVTQVITDEVENVPTQEIQPLSKKYVDDLIESLDTNDTTNGNRADDIKAGGKDGYEIVIHDGGTVERIVSEEDQSTAMASVVDYLITERGFSEKIGSLPYVPGQKNAILNTEPQHPSGEEMRVHKQLTNGDYLYTSLNKEAKQRYMRRFADMCGVSVDLTEGW